ncbi:mycothione reductase [Leucobacter sp. GX24907]
MTNSSALLAPDLAIIGSGSGNSLITPFWDDKQVVIAEGGVFGGTCLNVGCIPTKMFVRPAMLARTPQEAARLGVTMHTEHVDWASIRDRIFGRIDPISAGGRRYRDEELDHVELIEQMVKLDGLRAFVAADGTRVEPEQLVIAAGSRAVRPEVPGVDLPGVHTSDTVMRLDSLPPRVAVIGAGFIACEFAGVFSGLGSEVVQFVRGDRLMKTLDDDMSLAFTAAASAHWDVRLGRPLRAIRQGSDGTLLVEVGGEDQPVEVDIVLLATGRRPNTDLIGAEEAGLDLHPDGRLAVDEFQRVTAGGEPVEGVYALGDICSAAQLKHVANYEARVVVHNLEQGPGRQGGSSASLRGPGDRPIPAAVFTEPELATVGIGAQQAAEQIGAEHVTVKVQRYGDTAYGWAMEDETGLCKVIADRRSGEILGAQVMGYQASNLIQPIIMAMSMGIDAHTAARAQYWIHPALMEVVENALLGLEVPEPAHPSL